MPALVCANGFPHFAISREQLLGLLNSPDPQQRLSAATSLGIRREVAALGALLEVVERPDEIEAVKVEALEALGMLRDPGVMPRLLDHLSREPAPRVRGQIVDLLGELGGEQAWSVLRTLLQTDPSPTVRGPRRPSCAAGVPPFLSSSAWTRRAMSSSTTGPVRSLDSS